MTDTNNLRARIAEELDRQPSDIIGSPSLSVGLVVNREINNTIRHYETSRFRWNEVRESEFGTTVSGTRTYSLPANFVHMDTLKLKYNNSYINVRHRVWHDVEDRDRQITGSLGIPSDFAIYGNVVRFYPVPNQAMTMVASYIKRFRPASLTGSFCSIVTMGGGSLTATSTASHNNPLNGWTTDGEALVRGRAIAAIEANYLKVDGTFAEMRLLAAAGQPYLSVREKLAYESLVDEAQDAHSAGVVRPYEV
jgi:hypothetical protein